MRYTGVVKYWSEDAAYDQLDALGRFRELNLHPEHDGDIDLVSYEKVGDEIRLGSDDIGALRYVMGFVSEDEDTVMYSSTGENPPA